MVPPTREAATLEEASGKPLRLMLRKFFSHFAHRLALVVCLITAFDIVANLVLNAHLIHSSIWITSELGLTVASFLVIVTFLTREKENSRLKRRLRLWGEIGDLSNPHLDFELALTRLLEKLKAFYDADDCLLISATSEDASYCVHQVTREGVSKSPHSNHISEECARRLFVVPQHKAFVYRRLRFPFFAKRYFGYDVIAKKRLRKMDDELESLLSMLDADVISVPVLSPKTASGRLFLTSQRKRAFYAADLEFLNQLVGQIVALLEDIHHADTVAASAREQERQRIALDIHDTVIQRYIGIQLGVEAIRQKIQAGGTNIDSDLEKLEQMTHFEVTGLRRYAEQLCGAALLEEDFLTAVRRLGHEFSSATGIAVTVKSGRQVDLNQGLAGEAFKIIAEGLSNIHRHTKASEAVIEIDSSPRSLNLKICNNGRNGDGGNGKFLPKSITSRAALLGGAVEIELVPQGKTQLSIGIPI